MLQNFCIFKEIPNECRNNKDWCLLVANSNCAKDHVRKECPKMCKTCSGKYNIHYLLLKLFNTIDCNFPIPYVSIILEIYLHIQNRQSIVKITWTGVHILMNHIVTKWTYRKSVRNCAKHAPVSILFGLILRRTKHKTQARICCVLYGIKQ